MSAPILSGTRIGEPALSSRHRSKNWLRAVLSMRSGRHMFFPDLRCLRCRAGLVESQQVQSFVPSFFVKGAVFVVGAFDNALTLKNGLQFLHIVSGDVEKRFILWCVCHRFPYEWSRGIERSAAVQLATLVDASSNPRPYGKGWYRTAFSWKCLYGFPYIMQLRHLANQG
ncbi:hypothetical protein J3P71_07345 [Rhizobium leguminosarum]|nr:hypothetical protein J3P71_07345 [Rhizobium leguminosarum]